MDWQAFWPMAAIGMFVVWLFTLVCMRRIERVGDVYRDWWKEEAAMRRSLMYGTPQPDFTEKHQFKSQRQTEGPGEELAGSQPLATPPVSSEGEATKRWHRP